MAQLDLSRAGWADRVIEGGWLLLAAGVPLVVAPWGRNAFELPKTALLWTVVAVMGVAWLLDRQLPIGRPADTADWPERLWQTVLVGFLVVFLLATLFSVNPLQSAQGSYDRMQGALTVLCYLALFLLTADRLHSREQILRLLAAIAWGSAPVVVYGLLQFAGLDPMAWRSEGSPAISTLGRSNFLGAYLVLVLPFTWASIRLAERRVVRWGTAALLGLQIACLLVTKARAAWLGALAAGGILCLAAAWQRGHCRLAAAAAVTGVVGLAAGLVALGLTSGLEGSAGARALTWRAAIPLITRRPILGYGPETFGLAFTSVFPPQLVYAQGRAVVVDRAHNWPSFMRSWATRWRSQPSPWIRSSCGHRWDRLPASRSAMPTRWSSRSRWCSLPCTCGGARACRPAKPR